MQSPVTGKEMRLVKEPRTLNFRKEAFEVVYHYYLCEESSEQFTTTELDTLNVNQVHNQYRAKYGIPFVDEIKAIREKYGLSAAKMSEVLGLGANVYRQYESGEMPSVATGRLIRLAANPKEFNDLLEIGKNALEEHEYSRVQRKVQQAIHGWPAVNEQLEKSLFPSRIPSIYTGYRVPDLERIGTMVKFFADNVKPFTTALNKLMFYADFVYFKTYGSSISGLSYKALQRGPVPVNYNGIYNQLENAGYVRIEEEDFRDFIGEKFFSEDTVRLKTDEPLTASELDTLNRVAATLGNLSTKKIVERSHNEEGWKKHVSEYGQISYVHAFNLQPFE